MASNKKDLKAFVRFDGTGRVIPSSVILARTMPKVGNWRQIKTYECCEPMPVPIPPDQPGDFLIQESGPRDYILQEDNGRIIY